MEGFKLENNNERGNGVSLALDQKEINGALGWGQSIEKGVKELIKIFSIVDHIKQKGIKTREEVEKIATDLFDQLDVEIYQYDIIFTDNVINQILGPGQIDTISFKFNDIPVVIRKGSTVKSVMEERHKASEIKSPEAIEKWEKEQKSRKEAAQQEQVILDRMIIELDTLDFSNQEKAIDWLHEYYTHYSDGVDMHDDKVVEKFEAHGYSPEQNDAIDGMLGETLKDKERLGKVIIGYLLVNGALALQRNSWFKNKIEDWKKL